jgi:hypothetical protein
MVRRRSRRSPSNAYVCRRFFIAPRSTVRALIFFFCLLAYYVEWHLQRVRAV